ncbi:hypothetical protein C8Q79DRAFT_1015094 [Trametes meyenii]|nr:hypothetical protein C8Q79DRAFT_1015094 [Trametes meyenii]
MATEKEINISKEDDLDNDDVRAFITMGGQVHWANVVYRTCVRDCDIDPELRQITPPREHQSEREDTTYQRIWSNYMSDVPYSPHGQPSPRGSVAGGNESKQRRSLTVHATSEHHAAGFMDIVEKEYSRDEVSSAERLEVSSIYVNPNVSVDSTLGRTQLIAHAPSWHIGGASNAREKDPFPAELSPNPMTSRDKTPLGLPFSVSTEGGSAQSSPSFVKIEDTEVEIRSPSVAASVFSVQEQVDHHTTPAAKQRAKPYDRPQIGTLGSQRKKTRAGVSPQCPPKGFVTEWATRDAKWVWDGKALPKFWTADTVWDRLNALGVHATNAECRWKGCPLGGKKLVGLKRHIEGVHLECKFRCTGCGLLSPRYDMWKRTKHELGCPVAPLHPENGYYKAAVKAKMEGGEDGEYSEEEDDALAGSGDCAEGEAERVAADAKEEGVVGSSAGYASESSEEYDQLDPESGA